MIHPPNKNYPFALRFRTFYDELTSIVNGTVALANVIHAEDK